MPRSIPRATSDSASSSRWNCSSASMLCSNAGDGIDPRRRRIRAAALSMFEDASDGGRDALPACGLFSELLSARLGEAIELRTPVVFGITPGGFDPALLLE